MGRGIGRQTPAMVVAIGALLAALGGSVYAATEIDGRSIRVKSLPGNRLVPGSLAADRLKPGTLPGNRLAPGSLTGRQIDAATLGQVPSAVYAEQASSARDAGTARYAASAADAASVNGHVAGCAAGTRAFAGACWQVGFTQTATTAPAAARACAEQGGELPQPLALLAFGQQPGIAIAAGGEWTGALTNASGIDSYAVFTVLDTGEIDYVLHANARKYRCVLPLLS